MVFPKTFCLMIAIMLCVTMESSSAQRAAIGVASKLKQTLFGGGVSGSSSHASRGSSEQGEITTFDENNYTAIALMTFVTILGSIYFLFFYHRRHPTEEQNLGDDSNTSGDGSGELASTEFPFSFVFAFANPPCSSL